MPDKKAAVWEPYIKALVSDTNRSHPRRLTQGHAFMMHPDYKPLVDAAFAEEWPACKARGEKAIRVRQIISERLLKEQYSAPRETGMPTLFEELQEMIEERFQEEMEEYKADANVPTNPDQFNEYVLIRYSADNLELIAPRARARLPEIVAPLLHGLSQFTGMSLVLLGGAPPREGIKEGYAIVE